MYALADCNNFFVSCERVFRPDLWDKPVLVLSGNDGCVVSRSNEVKALGIKMGVPLYQIRDLVEKHRIACFSSNFSLYGDLSARVMSLLRKHTTRFEQYSIDEGFITLDHVSPAERKTYCENLVREIYQGTGIPVSMGIAPSKTLCKVASKYAKKYPGYNGACMIDTDEKRLKALAKFEIGDVWGVGRQTAAKLAALGISTALQFAEMSESRVQSLLHKPGLLTWRELHGIDCIDTSEMVSKQSITTSRTFANPITTLPMMEQQLANFCDTCARKLRMQKSLCAQLIVFAYTSRFRTDIEQCQIVQTVNLSIPTSDTRELLSYMLNAFRPYFREGVQFKKAGVIFSRIVPEGSVVADLFDERNRSRDAALQRTIDKIRDKSGRNAILLATQLPFLPQSTGNLSRSTETMPRSTETMPPSTETFPQSTGNLSRSSGTSKDQATQVYKSEHQSPHYTTELSQILTIRI